MPYWRRGTEPQLDATGQPFLQVQVEGRMVQLGLSRGNALRLSAPPELVQGLLLTRLEQELKPSKRSRVSRQQVEGDWKLLEGAVEARQAALTAERSGPHSNPAP